MAFNNSPIKISTAFLHNCIKNVQLKQGDIELKTAIKGIYGKGKKKKKKEIVTCETSNMSSKDLKRSHYNSARPANVIIIDTPTRVPTLPLNAPPSRTALST